jgi:hypothetical protein
MLWDIVENMLWEICGGKYVVGNMLWDIVGYCGIQYSSLEIWDIVGE